MTGLAALAAAWLGPLPHLARHSFSAHMALHITVVAICAPLIAAGIANTRFDPVPRWPQLFAPIPASILELVAVWGWHLPALHQAARAQPAVMLVEQSAFLVSGLLLWMSALGGLGAPAMARGSWRWRAALYIGPHDAPRRALRAHAKAAVRAFGFFRSTPRRRHHVARRRRIVSRRRPVADGVDTQRT